MATAGAAHTDALTIHHRWEVSVLCSICVFGKCDVLLRVSMCLLEFECVREELTASESNDCFWRLCVFWERDGHCNSCVYVTAMVKKATSLWCLWICVHDACMWKKKNVALLIKAVVSGFQMSCFFCVFFFSDEGPYTKHSNPSRPPDGALAIRRQSIPGTKHNVQHVTFFIWRCGIASCSKKWLVTKMLCAIIDRENNYRLMHLTMQMS